MPNPNAPFGLKPINLEGIPWSGQGRMVALAATEPNNIFIGDPVVPLGGTDANGVPLVGLAAAGSGNTVLGSFLGITNGPAVGANGSATLLQNQLPFRTGGVLTYGLVTPDPNQVFAIMEDSVGGAIPAATGGFANANLVAGAGSTATFISGWKLQSSSVGVGATLQVRILSLLRAPDNAIGTNAVWAVRLNLPALWAATGY